MSISAFFSALGAPLHNIMWSWGAISNKGEVFLRVWQDQTRKINEKMYVRVTDYAYSGGSADLGFSERQRHIAKLREGFKGFVIFCIPKSPVTAPRSIQNFVKDKIFPTAEIIEIDGDVWVQFTVGVRVKDFLAAREQT